MYRNLGSATLRTGEQLQLGVVECPDPSWGAQIMPLLGHKSQDTHVHFQSAFAGPLDHLETRCNVRPMRWDDWAAINLLAFELPVAGEPVPRSWTFGVKGQGGGAEGRFQVLQRAISRGSHITPFVLENNHGAVVGWAILQPDELT